MLRNLTWLSGSSLLVKPIWFGFITIVVIGRIGVAQYGAFTAALALAGIAVGLLTAGLSAVVVRDVARGRASANVYAAQLFPLRFVMGLLALVLLEAIAPLLGSPAGLVRVAWSYWFMLNLLEFTRSFFQAAEQMRYEAESVVVEKTLVVGFGLVGLSIHPDAFWLLAGMSVGAAGAIGWSVWRMHRRIARLERQRIDASVWRHVVGEAWPLGLSAIFVMLYARTDSVMIEAIRGEVEAGQYGLAFRIPEALVQLPALLIAVLAPRLARLYGAGDGAAFDRVMRLGFGAMLALGLVASGATSAMADWIVSTIDDSPELAPAAGVLRVMAWTFAFSCLSYLASAALIATDNQQVLVWVMGGAALLNLTLNAVLIPQTGAMGATVATLATQAFVLVALLGCYAAWRRRYAFQPEVAG